MKFNSVSDKFVRNVIAVCSWFALFFVFGILSVPILSLVADILGSLTAYELMHPILAFLGEHFLLVLALIAVLEIICLFVLSHFVSKYVFSLYLKNKDKPYGYLLWLSCPVIALVVAYLCIKFVLQNLKRIA